MSVRSAPADMHAKIDERTACVAVIGLGYVGLPLAMAFAAAGYRVLGVDVVAARVQGLAAGRSHILDVPDEILQAQLATGRFTATTEYDVLRDADAVFVSVPTPFDRAKAPDLSYVIAAGEGIAPRLRAGQLVILESTTFPGTTDEVLRPILERSGLKAGRDFYLAFSPERIDPGNRQFKIGNTPKVVGGVDQASTHLAVHLLQQVVREGGVHAVSSARAAELTKLLENTFRAVNIALVNELAILCDRMDIDIWEVIEAAKTKPYGFMPFYPGPGVGGHCLLTGESVVVHDTSGAGPRTVDELWHESTSHVTARRAGRTEVVDGPAFSVLGVGIDGPADWERVTHMFRRSFDGTVVNVRTVDGRDLVVTDEHPMLVATDAGVQVKQARDLVPGDLLPVIGELAEPGDLDPTVDVIAAMPALLTPKVRVAVREGSWTRLRDTLRARYGAARTHDWIRCGQIPLGVYLELDARGVALHPRDRLMLWTGRGPARASLPAVVRITPDVARLIGYYATEGCITTDSSQRVRFTFHAQEDEVLADLEAILASLGQRWSTSHDRSCANVHVKVSSQLFAVLLRDALCCGTSSYDSAVPEVLLAAGRRHRLALFAGLLRGDGSVDVHTGPRRYLRKGRDAIAQNNSANVGFWTTSVRLERQFSFLAQSLGFRTSIQRRRTQPGADFHILDAEKQPLIATLLADTKRDRLADCLAAKRRTVRSRGTWRMAGQAVAAVAEVTPRAARTTVYSLETARTNTFATGYGVFVHNCIPVDPYYLSWKARQYDFHTKFIELAAETNLAMPFFTVDRVRRLLSEADLPLHGARILALGASFKKNIDDARNSAAVRVMEILRSEGARIDFHDPYVPEIQMHSSLFADNGKAQTLRSVALTEEAVRQADCIVILVGHSNVDYGLVLRCAKRVFDAVNATLGMGGSQVVERL